jgi:hypothetical protein
MAPDATTFDQKVSLNEGNVGCGGTPVLLNAVSINNSGQAVFTPKSALKSGTTYVLSLGSGIADPVSGKTTSNTANVYFQVQ